MNAFISVYNSMVEAGLHKWANAEMPLIAGQILTSGADNPTKISEFLTKP